jgi:hypothetical protein
VPRADSHPSSPLIGPRGNGRKGAGRAVPGAKAEWPRRVESRPDRLHYCGRAFDGRAKLDLGVFTVRGHLRLPAAAVWPRSCHCEYRKPATRAGRRRGRPRSGCRSRRHSKTLGSAAQARPHPAHSNSRYRPCACWNVASRGRARISSENCCIARSSIGVSPAKVASIAATCSAASAGVGGRSAIRAA